MTNPDAGRAVNVMGDSHVVALGHGLKELRDENAVSFAGRTAVQRLFSGNSIVEAFFRNKAGALTFSDRKVRRAFTEVTGRSTLSLEDRGDVFAFMFGLTHRRLALRFSRAAMVPVSIAVDAPASSYSRVSLAAVESVVRAYNANVLGFFAAAQALELQFCITEPPPMRDDDVCAHPVLGAKVYGETDKLFRDIMKAEYRARGFAFVETPLQAFDSAGLMKAEFKHPNPKDDHHANGAYGRLMLDRIWRFAEQSQVAPCAQRKTD